MTPKLIRAWAVVDRRGAVYPFNTKAYAIIEGRYIENCRPDCKPYRIVELRHVGKKTNKKKAKNNDQLKRTRHE